MPTSICQDFISELIRWLSHRPAFRIFGRASYETQWQTIDIFATRRRDADSRWPLWRGHCITLTANVIAVGCDFATEVIAEQAKLPASKEYPVSVFGGRLRGWGGVFDAPELGLRKASAPAIQILAHECGHTGQARRMGWVYWPYGAAFTLFREGPHWWNRFENEASETGQFGGIVARTLHPRLANL